MNLSQAKVGDVVFVYCVPQIDGSLMIGAYQSPNSIKNLANVLVQGPGAATILGWKQGERHPNNYGHPILDSWKLSGIVFAHIYGSHCECELAGTPTNISQKDYGNECPCGIYPPRCDYHKP